MVVDGFSYGGLPPFALVVLGFAPVVFLLAFIRWPFALAGPRSGPVFPAYSPDCPRSADFDFLASSYLGWSRATSVLSGGRVPRLSDPVLRHPLSWGRARP